MKYAQSEADNNLTNNLLLAVRKFNEEIASEQQLLALRRGVAMIDPEIALDHIHDLAEQIRDLAGKLYASDQGLHIRSIVDYAELMRYHVGQQMGTKCK